MVLTFLFTDCLLITREKNSNHNGVTGPYLDQLIEVNISDEGQMDIMCLHKWYPEKDIKLFV